MNTEDKKTIETVQAQIESNDEGISVDQVKKMLEEGCDDMIEDDVSDSSFNPNDVVSDSEDEEANANEGSGEESDSGEEEQDVRPKEISFGGHKLYKLIYKDIEDAKIKRQKELEAEESSSDEEAGKENKPKKGQSSFMEYREALTDEEIGKYKSGDDDDFDPMYCGDTLSDQEYDLDNSQEGREAEEETDDEVETEVCDSVNKRTGEQLMMLKITDLKIPPPSNCSTEPAAQRVNDAAMEVV